tara:strand:+ start:3992 stop:4216 length:225 start_codon:yes stop_codon:yes gene_type:complete
MKKVELKYLGFKNKNYCFKDNEDKLFNFSSARADLIFDFNLREKTNINVQFEVKYFISYDKDSEAQIISDLRII